MAGTCYICNRPAWRKCTRCGQLFCELHGRYGNPHFTVGSFGGGTGYYCDNCWARYEREGRIVGIILIIFFVILAIFAIIWVLIATGIARIGYNILHDFFLAK
jgi:hypothetical protein